MRKRKFVGQLPLGFDTERGSGGVSPAAPADQAPQKGVTIIHPERIEEIREREREREEDPDHGRYGY